MRRLGWLALWASVGTWDRLRFAAFRARFAGRLEVGEGVSPHLRFTTLRIAEGGRVQVGAGFATERQPGNAIWVHESGSVVLGERTWLRTEHGRNQITVFPGARVQIGRDALLNGAMLHAKSGITIGDDARLAFGVRVIDSDMHPIDCETPERSTPVVIGDRVWIGADCLILRGVRIGSDVVVGAGSIVTRDLPDRCLALGTPARPVRALASRQGCP
jgi:serine acetyltransferase